MVVFGLGWVLAYDELVALGLGGLVLVVVALAWGTYRPRVEVTRTIHPDRVTVGEPAIGVLTVRNPGRRSSPPPVAFETYGRATLEVAVPRLAPGVARDTPYELPTQRRGVIDVGPLLLRRSDPFGLVTSGKNYGAVDTLWVHPRVHTVGALPSGRSRDLDGPTSDTAPQGGMAFHTLREYVHGDDLRQIHWRSSARTGTLMVRHMVDSSQPVTTVVLDTRKDRYEREHFELAVEAAASIVVACRRQNFPVVLHGTDGHVFGNQRGPVSTTEILDHLAGVEWAEEGDVLQLVSRLAGSPAGGSLVFITGKPDIADLPVVSRLRRSFDSTVVLRVHDELDITLGDQPGSSGLIPGALVFNVANAREFTGAWNRLARA